MKEIHFRLRNIDSKDYEALTHVAYQTIGRPSPTALARHLIKSAIPRTHVKSSLPRKNNRIEVRLSDMKMAKLTEQAQANEMTLNQYIRLILNTHINKAVPLTTAEISALRESNFQLYKIGQNLNQIAKALNSQLPVNLTSQFLEELQRLIDSHFEKVGDLIQKSSEKS